MQVNTALLLVILLSALSLCYGHGYMSRPAARGVIYDADPRKCPYGDECGAPVKSDCPHCLAAGGPSVVYADCNWGTPGCTGKFGLCGDKWTDNPQENLEGGKFYSGLVNAIYEVGQTVYITITITAHHMGFHEFVLYVHPDSAGINSVTTNELEHHLLKQVSPNLDHTQCSYHTIDPSTQFCMPSSKLYYLEYKLPAGVECKRCTLQWHWVTGNSPGANPEEFWNCGDITISKTGPFMNNERIQPPTEDGGTSPSTTGPGTTTTGPSTTTGGGTTTGCSGGKQCVAVPGNPQGIGDEWCAATGCPADYVEAGICMWSECHDHGAHFDTFSQGGGGYVPNVGTTKSNKYVPMDDKLECIHTAGEYYLCKKTK